MSNGKLWEFGQLQGNMFTKNIKYYILENIGELMGAINFIFAESKLQLLNWEERN